MAARPRAPGVTVHALLFVSGASSLAFELVWIRALGLYFGTTVGAITTVVATYTGGLALGAVVLGRVADKSRAPLRLYGAIELAIGLTSTAVSLLLLRGVAALAVLARIAAAAGALAGVVRALEFSLILLAPATLMGGTIPILARARTHTDDGGRAVGLLYASNTTGAVVGALLPDGLLIPALGLTFTVFVAALGNFVVALIARRLPESPSVTGSTPAAAAIESTGSRPRAVATLLFAVSGFCAMGYEVLWSRVLEHLVEGLVIGFSVLLAVYLVAVAVGSRLTATRADRTTRPIAWAAACLSASGFFAFGPLALLPRFTAVLAARFPLDPSLARAAESRWWGISLADSLFLETVSCLLMGAAFPFLAAVCVREGVAGRRSGRLYATNAVCGVAGAFAAGFLILPTLGAERGLLVLAGLAVAVGTVVLFATERATPPRLGAGALALATLAVGLVLPEDQFRRTFLAGSDPLYAREGTTTSVAVVSHSTFGTPTWRELRTPGVSMSDTRFSSRRYMGLMGHLPMFLADRHAEALLICFGVGNTARSLLSHADLDHLDVVDISREVLAASRFFAAVTSGDPLTDPRARAIVDDGRHYLMTTDRTYDVVTSEPPPPSHAGVVNLYTREYYRAARRVLRPGGVLAQWLPMMQLSEDDVLAIVAAMAAEFPHVELRYGFGYQWILLGSDAPRPVDRQRWTRMASERAVAGDLASLGVRGEPDLAATLIQTDAGLRAATAGFPPVEDDLPSIEYPLASVRRPPPVPRGLIGDLEPGEASGTPRGADEDAAAAMTIVLRALPERSIGSAELEELVFGTSMRAALRYAPAHPAIFALLDVDDVSRTSAAAWLATHPADPVAALVLVRRAYYEDDFAACDAGLDRIDPAAVSPARYWLLRGECALGLSRFEDASAALQRAAAESRDPRFRAAAAGLVRTFTAR